MNCTGKYYYEIFSPDDIGPDDFQKIKLEKIISNDVYGQFFTENTINYCIMYHNKLAGLFSFEIKESLIELRCLYIFEEYRNKSIGTNVINDLTFLARHEIKEDIKYILVNSFVESSMFFLKKGFDFCKINKKLDYKKKNIIKLYKMI